MLAPVYRELVAAVPPAPGFPPGHAGATTPPPDSLQEYRAAATALSARLQALPAAAALRYLGMTQVAAGTSQVGREAPSPYPDSGVLYIAQPQGTVTIPYDLWVMPRVVPNVLYDVYLAVRGAFQKRSPHSPGHLHPAVNVTQGNAIGLLEWLSEQVGFELRLPTEPEWEHIAQSTTTGGARGARKFRLEDPYMTLAIDDAELARDSDDPLGLYGNTWEITTPSLTENFIRLPGADGRIVDGHIYHAKGGGFQHCGQGADSPYAFPKFIAERTASTGFRFVTSESPNGRARGGWRRRTKPVSGNTVWDDFGIGHSTVQVVQSASTTGLSIKVNGRTHVLAPDGGGVVALPRRGNTLSLVAGERAAYQTEHLLAALAGADVWNACILLDGEPAPPARGYCALDFSAAITAAGFVPGAARELVVAEPIAFARGDSHAEILPGPFQLQVEIDFPHLPGVGRQTATYDPRLDDFAAEVAPARTFIAEVVRDFAPEQVRLTDLGRYAHPDEAPLLIYDGEGWNHAFHFPNEPARHKLLDMLGDLTLLNMPLIGSVRAYRPGHAFNVELARFLHRLSLEGDERIQVRDRAPAARSRPRASRI